MKKNILTLFSLFLLFFLIISPAMVQGEGSSGSGESSSGSSSSSNDDSKSSSSGSDDSSSGSSSGSDDSSNSSGGLETETEHGVTFTKPHSSGDDFFGVSSNSSEGMEVETEHGVTFLKAHNSADGTDSSRRLGVSSEGMEVETEHGVTFLKPHDSNRNSRVENAVAGRIVLQVEDKGQAWYIDPVTKSKIFLGRPNDAFQVMREHALGISNDDLNRIARADDNNRNNGTLAKRLAGRIVLQVEDKGQAWYINPVTLRRHLLGRPDDAFKIMRGLGLGISNNHLDALRLFLGRVGERHLTAALLTDNDSGVSGIVQIKEIAGKVKVEIKLLGATATSSYPAHIHVGNRPNLGAIKYPLNNVVNGLSETTLNTSLDQLLSERPLGINIHKSAAEINISVASGNL